MEPNKLLENEAPKIEWRTRWRSLKDGVGGGQSDVKHVVRADAYSGAVDHPYRSKLTTYRISAGSDQSAY